MKRQQPLRAELASPISTASWRSSVFCLVTGLQRAKLSFCSELYTCWHWLCRLRGGCWSVAWTVRELKKQSTSWIRQISRTNLETYYVGYFSKFLASVADRRWTVVYERSRRGFLSMKLPFIVVQTLFITALKHTFKKNLTNGMMLMYTIVTTYCSTCGRPSRARTFSSLQQALHLWPT